MDLREKNIPHKHQRICIPLSSRGKLLLNRKQPRTKKQKKQAKAKTKTKSKRLK